MLSSITKHVKNTFGLGSSYTKKKKKKGTSLKAQLASVKKSLSAVRKKVAKKATSYRRY